MSSSDPDGFISDHSHQSHCSDSYCIQSHNGMVDSGTNTNTSNHPVTNQIPSLDELLNDCFVYSVQELDDYNKVDMIKSFKTFVKSLHCEENLKFLISIYNYEFLFNTIFHQKPVLNKRKNSIRSLDTFNSFKSNDNFPSNYFASTIDDIPINSIDCTFGCSDNYWDNLRDKCLDDDDDDDVDSDIGLVSRTVTASSNVSSGNEESSNPQVLINYWNFIINSFILPNSKFQVNLSSKASKCILDEVPIVNDSHLPNPSLFLKSKQEIIQLLSDNIYQPFILKYKQCQSLPCNDCSCGIKDNNNNNGGDDCDGEDYVNSDIEEYHVDAIEAASPSSGRSITTSPSTGSNLSSSFTPSSAKKMFNGSLKLGKSFKSRASSPVSINSFNSGIGQSPKCANSPMLSPTTSHSNNSGTTGSPLFKKPSNLNSISSILTHLKLNGKSSRDVNSPVDSHSNSASNLSSLHTPSHKNSFESIPIDDEKRSKFRKPKK